VAKPRIGSRVEALCVVVKDEKKCASEFNPYVLSDVRCKEFKCPDGRCLSPRTRCDGMNDCDGTVVGRDADKPDAALASTRYSLDEWRNTTVDSDGDKGHCMHLPLDPSQACKRNEFTCGNGQCIPDVWECDDVEDCSNKWDE
jgi:hypothetical protein